MDENWTDYKTMSKRRKFFAFLRVMFIIVVTVGLTFQTLKLVGQYRKGMTVVNISYENKGTNHLPGITICYPVALSMAKMAEKYPHLKPVYEEYMEELNRMTDNERKKMSSFSALSNIYFKNFTKFIYHGEYSEQFINLKDYFELSIPNEVNLRGSPTISIKIYGIPINGSADYSDEKGISDDTPIESIVFKHKNSWNKCFTFYSHLNEKWRDFQMDITKVYILVTHNDSWYPRDILMENEIQLSMHSPNELPRHDVEYYVDLKPNRFIKLTYNRWETHLLGEGYQTNCSDYNMDNKRMRSDCVKHCIQQKLRKFSDCNETNSCETCLFLTTTLWTKNDLKTENFTNICNNFVKMNYSSVSTESKCQNECRPKCEDHYYIYEIKMVSDFETPNTTVITIQHNQLPDQITRHIPEMTDIQFVSNLCVIFVFLIILFKL